MRRPPLSKGFFHSSQLAQMKAPLPILPQCGACGLYKTCKSPKMEVYGKGRRKILIVGEAPGEDEDDKDRPFCGKSSQELKEVLAKCGVDMDKECWLTNALICRPPKNEISDDKMIDYCRPNLVKTITELEPEIIIPLGGIAVESLLGWLWKDDVGAVTRWVGWNIPYQRLNCWICPTWHPSYVLRAREQRNEVPGIMFAKHLDKATAHDNRPGVNKEIFDGIQTFTGDASQALHEFHISPKTHLICFDFETDRLKPDHKDAWIVCCSVTNGVDTLAFPWEPNKERVKAILEDPSIGKMSHNMKFEDRWCRREGIAVANWVWCSMNNAHILDNRSDITSLKFQTFVRLGLDEYDSHIKPFLYSDGGGNAPNRIKEVYFPDLLKYCALDSIYEYEVAQEQMKEMKLWIK